MSRPTDLADLKRRLEQLVALNTENPPGRESETGELLRAVLSQLGCRTEAIEFEPERVNVAAVLDSGPGPVFAGLRELVATAARDAGTPMEIAAFNTTTGGATETAADDPVVVAAQHACAHHNGAPSALGGFQGGCDLVHFRSVGASGVVLGPGSVDVAHKPDEFIPEEELARAASIYHDIARTLFGGGEPETPQGQSTA